MGNDQEDIFLRMNELGSMGEPFVFLIDFDIQKPLLYTWEESREYLLWHTPRYSNFREEAPPPPKEFKWDVMPVSYGRYKKAFDLIQKHIHNGDSYLLNLTMPTQVDTDLSLDEIFRLSKSAYRVYLKNQFVSFSPEIFIRIEDGKISSYPMKGTIDATIPNAEQILKTDKKELAEHNTIVDLIRNDLSRVAENVEVSRFCYIDKIHSNKKDLLQMSSKVKGKLHLNYQDFLGDIIKDLLPAGSISGAPKKKTVEIIKEAENYDRGYYTGIFGAFDGKNLDSCVIIRFLEKENGQMIFKSGGGITHLSDCEYEYREMVNKVYVPIT